MRSGKVLQSNLDEIAILVTKHMVFHPGGRAVWRKRTRKERASFLLKRGFISYGGGRRCPSGEEGSGAAQPEGLRWSVQDHGGKVILRGLGPADEPDAAVRLEEQLGGAQLAVVVVAHGKAVGASVVDDQQVA